MLQGKLSKTSTYLTIVGNVTNRNRFIPGHVTLASTVAMSFVLTCIMSWYLRRENARREQWAIDNNLQPEDYTDAQKYEERQKGDNATFYRYTV